MSLANCPSLREIIEVQSKPDVDESHVLRENIEVQSKFHEIDISE